MIFLAKFGFPIEFMSIQSHRSGEDSGVESGEGEVSLFNFDLIYIRISDRLNNVMYVIYVE